MEMEALDPPPFEISPILQCIRHATTVQRLDERPDSVEEFLILTPITLSAEEMLHAGPAAMADGDGGAGADDGGGDDMSYDSDSYGSVSEEESEEDSGDDDDPNQGAPMKAFLKGRTPVRQSTHGGTLEICIYHAKVLQKAGPGLNWTETGDEVAIKEVSWEAIQTSWGLTSEDVVKEVAALQYVSEWQKQNGRSILDTHVMSAEVIMSDDSNLYIVMPWCTEGCLWERVANEEDDRLTEAESRHWFRQILQGLESLRLMGICHKDLSPENILIYQGGSLVIDFGMCLRIPRSDAGVHPIARRWPPCGKLPHIAPEIYLGHPLDGHAVDLWAAGTILHFMLTGTRFPHPLYVERHLRMCDWGISDGAMDLLTRMLRRDLNHRLRSLEEVRDHPWVQG